MKGIFPYAMPQTTLFLRVLQRWIGSSFTSMDTSSDAAVDLRYWWTAATLACTINQELDTHVSSSKAQQAVIPKPKQATTRQHR